MYIYEGYFNNVDNTVDTDNIIHSQETVNTLKDVIFSFTLMTYTSIAHYVNKFEDVKKLYTNTVKKTVHNLCNVLEVFDIVDDYYLVFVSNDIMSNMSFNEFIDYSVDKFEKQYNEYVEFIKNDDTKYNYNPQLEHFNINDLSIAVKFNKNLPVRKAYTEFSKLVLRYGRILDNFLSGNLSIDEFKLVGYYDNKNDFDDAFSTIFNIKSEDIKTQSKTETLNLHYVEPPKMTRTFLQKAKSYKSYLCLDVNDNYVITQKLNKDVHKHIIGLCVDSSINTEGKLTVLFCPLKFISLIQPELGSVGKCGNVVFCKDDMKDITVIDTQDGITGTKLLYDFANKSAEESGSFDTNWKNGMISNISRVGFFPVLNAIYRFRTPGTQSGNWHLGSPKENQRLYKLSSYIDKKISDKLFDDFWNFGMKKYFYMSTSEYLASCNIEKSKDCNLWYNVYTKIDGDSVVSDRTFVDSKTFVAIPLLRLTAK